MRQDPQIPLRFGCSGHLFPPSLPQKLCDSAMGKGSNVSKTNRARADAAKKAADEGKGGGGSSGIKERAAPLAVVCAICRSGFMAQQTKEQLMTHVDSKRE